MPKKSVNVRLKTTYMAIEKVVMTTKTAGATIIEARVFMNRKKKRSIIGNKFA